MLTLQILVWIYFVGNLLCVWWNFHSQRNQRILEARQNALQQNMDTLLDNQQTICSLMKELAGITQESHKSVKIQQKNTEIILNTLRGTIRVPKVKDESED